MLAKILTTLFICSPAFLHLATALQNDDELYDHLDNRWRSVQGYLYKTLADSRPNDYHSICSYIRSEIYIHPYEERVILDYLFWSIHSNMAKESLDELIDHVVEDTKRSESHQSIYYIVNKVYQLMLSDKAIEPGSPRWNKHFGLGGNIRGMENPTDYVDLTFYITQAMKSIPKESWGQLIETLNADVAGSVIAPFAQAGAKVSEASGGTSVATVKLAAVHLSWKTVENIHQWWTGAISGKRCAKNIMQEVAAASAGAAGSYIGGAVGLMAGGPGGAVAGSLIGGYFTYFAVSGVTDRFLLDYFDLPKEVVLENAYNFLGVHWEAENAVVNKAFRKLSLKHHPDKGGDQNKFTQLQLSMGVIREHRKDW